MVFVSHIGELITSFEVSYHKRADDAQLGLSYTVDAAVSACRPRGNMMFSST